MLPLALDTRAIRKIGDRQCQRERHSWERMAQFARMCVSRELLLLLMLAEDQQKLKLCYILFFFTIFCFLPVRVSYLIADVTTTRVYVFCRYVCHKNMRLLFAIEGVTLPIFFH